MNGDSGLTVPLSKPDLEDNKISSPTSDELTPSLDNQEGLLEDRGRRRDCDSVNWGYQCKSWEVCIVGNIYGRYVRTG